MRINNQLTDFLLQSCCSKGYDEENYIYITIYVHNYVFKCLLTKGDD
jgi:hypothetical protein